MEKAGNIYIKKKLINCEMRCVRTISAATKKKKIQSACTHFFLLNVKLLKADY